MLIPHIWNHCELRCPRPSTQHGLLYLLGNHNGESSQVGASDTRNREKLGEAREIVVLSDNLLFNDELAVDVVDVPSHLDRIVP